MNISKNKNKPVRQQRQNCDEVSLKEQHIGLTWWNMAVNPVTPDAASEGWGKKTAWVKQWDSGLKSKLGLVGGGSAVKSTFYSLSEWEFGSSILVW